MSIKTTKRLALGVIASLVFAPLAVTAPAGAAAAAATPFGVTASSFAPADSFAATVAVQQLAGANNFVAFASGADTAGGGAGNPVVKVTGSTITNVSATGDVAPTGTLNAAATELVFSSADIYDADPGTASTFRVPTTTAGTITVVVANRAITNGVATDTTLQTFTITVLATAITNVYSAANSTVHAVKGAGDPINLANAAAADATTDAAAIATPISIPATSAGTVEALGILIDQEDANDVNLSTAVKNEISISPIGAVGTAVNTPVGNYATATGQNTSFFVFADGREGIATVTVSVNGVVAKTYRVNFYGAVATLVATSKASSIDADGGAEAGVFEVLATDKAGTPVPGATIAFDKAADSTLITNAVGAAVTDAAGKALVTVTPVAAKYGTTTVTVKVGTVISNAVTVVLAHNEVATATLALDKTTYLPGEKATLTLAAKDKNGLIVPDALAAANTMAFASNLGLSAAMGTGTAAWVAGSYTQTIFAPQTTTPTDWIITVKLATDAAFATALDGATLTAATVKVGFPVVVPEVVYEKPTLSFVVSGGRVFLSGTAEDGEGDIIIYVKRVGTTAWKERAKTLEVAAPGDFNGSIKAPKGNVVIRVKQEGTGLFSNQVIIVK